MMNVHHLELFYHVAVHGGISRAVRNMPYGIQQPAVSGQILLLEQELGQKLFERQPFRLTPAGEELFAFVEPFFGHLAEAETRLRKRAAPLLRLAAAELVLRDYLPGVIRRLQERHPGIQLALRSGFSPQMEAWLQERQIDLAITPLEGRPPARLRCLRLMRLPLVLLVPKRSAIKSAAELWARDRIAEPLIGLPSGEIITRVFEKGLKRRKVDWPVSIEASSMDLVARYVSNGYGIGAMVDVGDGARQPGVRALPLEGFEPLEIVALWHGEPTPLTRTMIEESQRFVRERWPQRACAERPDRPLPE